MSTGIGLDGQVQQEGRSERGQRRHRAGGIGKVEVGVGVHRQANIAVAYELLGYARRDAAAGQQGGEGKDLGEALS